MAGRRQRDLRTIFELHHLTLAPIDQPCCDFASFPIPLRLPPVPPRSLQLPKFDNTAGANSLLDRGRGSRSTSKVPSRATFSPLETSNLQRGPPSACHAYPCSITFRHPTSPSPSILLHRHPELTMAHQAPLAEISNRKNGPNSYLCYPTKVGHLQPHTL